LGVCDRALVILPYSGCSIDGFVEDLPHKLSKVESFVQSPLSRHQVLGWLSMCMSLSVVVIVAKYTLAACRTYKDT
jgi:hypothetical protein